jgi:hypothetical protein
MVGSLRRTESTFSSGVLQCTIRSVAASRRVHCGLREHLGQGSRSRPTCARRYVSQHGLRLHAADRYRGANPGSWGGETLPAILCGSDRSFATSGCLRPGKPCGPTLIHSVDYEFERGRLRQPEESVLPSRFDRKASLQNGRRITQALRRTARENEGHADSFVANASSGDWRFCSAMR